MQRSPLVALVVVSLWTPARTPVKMPFYPVKSCFDGGNDQNAAKGIDSNVTSISSVPGRTAYRLCDGNLCAITADWDELDDQL